MALAAVPVLWMLALNWSYSASKDHLFSVWANCLMGTGRGGDMCPAHVDTDPARRSVCPGGVLSASDESAWRVWYYAPDERLIAVHWLSAIVGDDLWFGRDLGSLVSLCQPR